jgi:hypothetical protein
MGSTAVKMRMTVTVKLNMVIAAAFALNCALDSTNDK